MEVLEIESEFHKEKKEAAEHTAAKREAEEATAAISKSEGAELKVDDLKEREDIIKCALEEPSVNNVSSDQKIGAFAVTAFKETLSILSEKMPPLNKAVKIPDDAREQ